MHLFVVVTTLVNELSAERYERKARIEPLVGPDVAGTRIEVNTREATQSGGWYRSPRPWTSSVRFVLDFVVGGLRISSQLAPNRNAFREGTVSTSRILIAIRSAGMGRVTADSSGDQSRITADSGNQRTWSNWIRIVLRQTARLIIRYQCHIR